MKSPVPASRGAVPRPFLSSSEFRRRFLFLVLVAWTLPPILGLSFLVWIKMFTPEQVRLIVLSPVESVWILGNIVFAFWFFRRYCQTICRYLDGASDASEADVVRSLQRFPVSFWTVFLAFLALAPTTVILSAEWFAGFDAQPVDWFRIHLVALIVSIVVGLPIFYLIFDLLGRALGEIRLLSPVLTIRSKVFLIGSLVPLLIDTLLVQYYWTRTGYFTFETFGVWLALEVAAIVGTLIFVRSFGQSLRPLEDYVLESSTDSADDSSSLVAQSTDELGVLTGRFRVLLERQQVLEERLVHSQKMEAIGQLAGGMAHDFNNILTSIVGFTTMVREQMGEDDPRREQLDQVLQSADRAVSLTRGLLTFSRRQSISQAPLNLNEMIRGLTGFLGRLLGEDIEVEVDLCSEALIVVADRSQLELVLMNLCANARDAMPGGGSLTLSTSRQNDAFAHDGAGVPVASLILSDTGVGMDEGTRARAFEPFFTTKEVGQGTGLGLAMVHGIVSQHGGSIEADSAPGEGTTISIFLPLSDQPLPDDEPVATERVPGGSETLLVAEDDATIRALLKNCLEDAGYSVVMARNGEEAVGKFMERADDIDLVVLDVIMPRKNGRVAYDEMRNHRPGIRALMMSGYTGDVLVRKGVGDIRFPLIRKPIAPHSFLRLIRETLDETKSVEG